MHVKKLFKYQCAHWAKLYTFSTLDTFIHINNRCIKAVLRQGSRGANPYRWASVILGTSCFFNYEHSIRGIFFAVKQSI